MLQCNFIFFAIVSGGVFFGEFAAFSPSQWVGFIFGVAVMFAGLGLLTPASEEPMGRNTRTGSNLGTLSRGDASFNSLDELDDEMPGYRHPAPSLYSIRNVGSEVSRHSAGNIVALTCPNSFVVARRRSRTPCPGPASLPAASSRMGSCP